DDSEEAAIVQDLLAAEAIAESSKRGLWKVKGAKPIKRIVSTDDNDAQFLNSYKGKPINAVIEQIRDGATFRIYLKLSGTWKLITLQLSGLKCPIVRVNIPGQPDLVEEFGLEARSFVETRLLQRDVTVMLEGSAGNGIFFGSIRHPAGNISELLLSCGLARVVDWSIAMVTGGPEKLRAAETLAKQKKIRLWKNYTPKASSSSNSSNFQATVIRIVNGDTLEIIDSDNNEREIQLSSIRQPKISDPKTAGYADEAKEVLRKRLAGQRVNVKIDYHKPAQDGFKARDCATVTRDGVNVSVELLKKGLANIIRHKQTDDQRSSCYDELLIADLSAVEKKLGIHSGKVKEPIKYTDLSGQAARAKSILPHLKRAGKLAGIVDYVSQGSRFRISIPRESTKITFVLGGIRCSRAGPDAKDALGNEALLFSKKRVMQRDVVIEIISADNTGGFIGNLFYSKETNLGIELLKAGLAEVHEYSASQMSNANLFFNAESIAKSARVGMWANYDESAEKAKEAEILLASQSSKISAVPNIEFIDLYISEMLDASNFYIQIAKKETLDELDLIMKELSISGKQPVAGATKAPRNGELVSAKFPSDNCWYRAKVKKVIAGRECELYSIDYGNLETVPIENIRPLDSKLAVLQPVAIESKLAFLKTPKGDYKDEAFAMVAKSVQGKKLTANIESRSGLGNNQTLYLTLYDSSIQSNPDISSSINSDIIRAGYATIDKKNSACLRNPAAAEILSKLVADAKRSRNGMWEYGDIESDDEGNDRF
ncbi:hypothetical protein AYI70_g4411, partial [Smittium culicis]